ncbi:hypothetical protein LOTGIDRAFT_219332 [Lottia gigantea]|uniref:tRNA dimethylallyltransferase n=1 Tax=Lottia gigantea TaxID=225164 RepID=V4BHK5_LOTGI|nr:hypothetical protein LOTGIDRAFT_219332 [Lottia gigantea]ESO88259.1 hypothetical protein LOTGIDRAFT_219332 [Lottia gigantea]
MAAPCRRIPVVVVLGATGTGKSKLAIEIGRRFNGEIISTDSMQIYKGLDIVTNKVTPQEQDECPHHMISYLSPLQYSHNVVNFRNKALPIIDKLISEEKVPIIVGGTNYYIESLLWNFLINKKVKASSTDDSELKKEEDPSVAGVDTIQLHKRLQEKDPELAKKIHPHNRRKIVRALEVYDVHGVKASDIYKIQQEDSGSNQRGVLRYTDPCLIWIQTDHDVLIKRLNDRVDAMIEKGLLKELKDFYDENFQQTLDNKRNLDYESGLFQLIGLKEFRKYLRLTEEEKNSDKGRELLEEGIELLKIATRQYAKKQIRWIKNRFLKSQSTNVPPVYSVNSTHVDQWDELVSKPAMKTVEAFMKGIKPDIVPEPFTEFKTEYEYNICDVCNGKVFITKFEWENHISCKKHNKSLVRKRKREGKSDIKRQKLEEDQSKETIEEMS